MQFTFTLYLVCMSSHATSSTTIIMSISAVVRYGHMHASRLHLPNIGHPLRNGTQDGKEKARFEHQAAVDQRVYGGIMRGDVPPKRLNSNV